MNEQEPYADTYEVSDYTDVCDADTKKKKLDLGSVDFSGLWNTVKTFCSFFSFITFFAYLVSETDATASLDYVAFVSMMIAGFVSLLISSGKEVFLTSHFIASRLTAIFTGIMFFTLIPLLIIATMVIPIWVFSVCLSLYVWQHPSLSPSSSTYTAL